MSKTDSRSTTQNNAYFLFQEFIASEMNNQNISLAKLVVEIQPKPTKTSLHEVFKAILLSMYGKDSTKGMTREELSWCLEVYMEALSKIWLHTEFPSCCLWKRNNVGGFIWKYSE